MKIGELFVSLGVKGAGEARQALSDVGDGLKSVKSMGLETKAMIAGVIYGLERLMSQSAQMGTGLSNFASLTGMSTKSLQQWQYAARQAGVSSEELTSNLKSVQNAAAQLRIGQGNIAGLATVSDSLRKAGMGGIENGQLNNTFYLMKKLQEFANLKGIDSGVQNSLLRTFGVTDGTISAFRKGVFNDKNFAAAPTYSENQISSLNKVDVAWGNLGQKIQMAVGRFTAKDGMAMVKMINDLIGPTERLAAAFIRFVEASESLQAIVAALKTLTSIMNEFASYQEGKTNFFGQPIDKSGKPTEGFSLDKWFFGGWNKGKNGAADIAAPTPRANSPTPKAGPNMEIHQTNHIHGVKDAEGVHQVLQREKNHAYWTSPAAVQAN